MPLRSPAPNSAAMQRMRTTPWVSPTRGDLKWRGWLWRASLGHRDPQQLMAYAPINLLGDYMDDVAYIRCQGRNRWEVVIYGEVLATRRTKSEAKQDVIDLLFPNGR